MSARRRPFDTGPGCVAGLLGRPGLLAAAIGILLALEAGAAAPVSFLDEVDRGRAAVDSAGGARLESASARAGEVDSILGREPAASPAFRLGALLASLDADIEAGTVGLSGRNRAAVEGQVRKLIEAQAAAGIGNRALCLLSGRPDPRSIEKLVRLVEPGWSCAPGGHFY